MKLPFPILDRAIRGNFDALAKRTRGVSNVTFSAAVSATTTGVPHGLGPITPTVINATAQNSSGLANVGVFNVGPITFDIGVVLVDGVARTVTVIVGWEAIP